VIVVTKSRIVISHRFLVLHSRRRQERVRLVCPRADYAGLLRTPATSYFPRVRPELEVDM